METLFKQRKEKLDIFRRLRKKEITLTRKEIPDHVVLTCAGCEKIVPVQEMEKNWMVCPHCNHHHRLTAIQRLMQILDPNTFVQFDKKMELFHPDFPGYKEKLEENKANTNLKDAVITGSGKIEGMKTVVAVMDSYFMMGSMGYVVGEKITRAIEYATKAKLPIIIFGCSGGARMQEGIISLMQMAKTSAALARHQEAKQLYISVMTHPTTGGVSASFASLGDIQIAEPQALIGFAGRRVIEKTINESLPKEFQRAEFLQEHGFIDLIVHRHKLPQTLGLLLHMHDRRLSNEYKK